MNWAGRSCATVLAMVFLARRAQLVLAGSVLVGWLAVTGPASAHEQNPLIVTVVDSVTPALPGLQVQLAFSIAPELLVSSTRQPLDVLDARGRAFLRIGPTRVLADAHDPAFYLSQDPFGDTQPPATAITGAPARFEQISTGASWGWFDPRLQPVVGIPYPVPDHPVTLASWTVPLLLGGRHVTVSGHVEFQPLLGRVVARAAPLSIPGASISLLDAVAPGLSVDLHGARQVLVFGVAGEPFARVTVRGFEVNTRSPTWLAFARLAHDTLPVSVDPRAAPVWVLLSADSRTVWIDPRLFYGAQQPPQSVLDSHRVSTLGRWAVPLRVDGRALRLTGTLLWDPAAGGPRPAGASTVHPGVVVAGVLLAGLGVLVVLRRRTRSRRGGAAR